MTTRNFLAFDLGASSGRAILGTISENKLSLKEIHRFDNQMVEINGSFFWNIFNLFGELKTGLKKCIRDYGIQPESVGVDTWGVDIALLDRNGMIVGLPYAYRDPRTDTAMEEFYQIIPKKELYLMTGIQLMQFNTLFQLYAYKRDQSPQLEIAKDILFMPDALGYLFCGVMKNEFSIASTSQFLKPGKQKFEQKLFDAIGFDINMMQEIVLPGTVLGNIKAEIQKETGSAIIPVVAVAGHDTASAIASVPATGNNWAYISSGTWSLMGIESAHPLISEEIQKLNFTNEGGVEGTTRFLKNIMGLWLLQECKRTWSAEHDYTWPEMVEMSKKAQPFKCIIDPDAREFLNPGDMPAAIAAFCRRTNQPEPETHGETIRTIFESLALKYRYTLDSIRSVSETPIEKIHIIGGGANNELLCQYAANAMDLPVYAGPTEATAIGNIMMQAKALGAVASLEGIRQMVFESFDTKIFIPQNSDLWNIEYQRFKTIITD
ncbi:MAG: rhamnulokinase family protein [Mariniphaga sp.]